MDVQVITCIETCTLMAQKSSTDKSEHLQLRVDYSHRWE